jgi:hypothetical protein
MKNYGKCGGLHTPGAYNTRKLLLMCGNLVKRNASEVHFGNQLWSHEAEEIQDNAMGYIIMTQNVG